MGYRLNIDKLEGGQLENVYYGTKLYGYKDESNFISFKYLLTIIITKQLKINKTQRDRMHEHTPVSEQPELYHRWHSKLKGFLFSFDSAV